MRLESFQMSSRVEVGTQGMTTKKLTRGTFKRALSIGALALTLTTTVSDVAMAAPDDGVTRKSVFVDMGATPAWETKARIRKICADLRSPSSDTYIHNVVLVGVVDPGSGELREAQLDAILPHVPGGSSQSCFDNVFIGPTLLSDYEKPWKLRPDFPVGLEPWCADSPYCGGILTPSWRWDNIAANRIAADTFLQFVNQRYPGVRANLNWYVTYEGYIDWFGDNSYSPQVKTAYEAYFMQSIREFRSALVAAGEPVESASRTVLWSPSYEDHFLAHRPQQLAAIRSGLGSALRNVENMAAEEGIARGIDWLHMQDRLGQIGCFTIQCYDSVAAWYEFLSTVGDDQFGFENLRVNMELFAPGEFPNGDPLEHQVRQNYYESRGVPIGASWELRFLLPDPPVGVDAKPPTFIPPMSRVRSGTNTLSPL